MQGIIEASRRTRNDESIHGMYEQTVVDKLYVVLYNPTGVLLRAQ